MIAPIAMGVAGIAVGGLSWGLIEARAFTVREVRVPVLPRGASAIRVLHISDLHFKPGQGKKASWLASLARLEPDVVVDTGDNIARADAVPALVDALGELLRVPGVFVHGSNDYFAPVRKSPFTYFRGPTRLSSHAQDLPWRDLTAALEGAGWRDLTNARASTELRGTFVDFVGLDDPHIGRDTPPERRAARPRGVRIGVVHAPYARALRALRDDGATLVLAGHTHGGQVRVPGIGALVTNSDLDRRRARGLHGWPGSRPDAPDGRASIWLHVSAGAGTSPLAPVRFACRPEATLLELVARPS